MSLRTNVNGIYDLDRATELGFPVAWSGTVSAEDRLEQEADLDALLGEIREALRTGDSVAVRIVKGEIVGLID